MDGRVVGAILCGHDGRRGCLYHVCVHEDYRMHGIGRAMVVHCMNALQQEGINKVSLIAFTKNDIGNAFWKQIGWTKREDLNYYDFVFKSEKYRKFQRLSGQKDTAQSDKKERQEEHMEIITGGVTAAKGFMAAGVEAGIKYQNRKDMAMVYSKPRVAQRRVYDECRKSCSCFMG